VGGWLITGLRILFNHMFFFLFMIASSIVKDCHLVSVRGSVCVRLSISCSTIVEDPP
jgi:hypothetical protein